jgi:hypothetical protein
MRLRTHSCFRTSPNELISTRASASEMLSGRRRRRAVSTSESIFWVAGLRGVRLFVCKIRWRIGIGGSNRRKLGFTFTLMHA